MRGTAWILMLIITLPVSGIDKLDSLYEAAGEAYSEGNYEQALENYREINEAGYESADQYFNMGNASFRSNKLGYAILYYKKALKLEPGHEQAEKNLAYVSRYREDHLDQVPELFLRKWVSGAYSLFSLETWSYISILFFALLLTGLLFYVFSRQLTAKKAGFFTAVITLLLFVFSLSASVERHKEISAPGKAVIVDPSVVVKSSPSLSGTDLFVLHEGTEVTMQEHISGWTEIRISDGRVGWIPGGNMVVI